MLCYERTKVLTKVLPELIEVMISIGYSLSLPLSRSLPPLFSQLASQPIQTKDAVRGDVPLEYVGYQLLGQRVLNLLVAIIPHRHRQLKQ